MTKLRFKWDGEEAKPNPKDVVDLMIEAASDDRILVLDFLADVKWEASRLYTRALAARDDRE